MKTSITDPWKINGESSEIDENSINSFADSFVAVKDEELPKLSDSDQYLERLYTRLKRVQGGTSKKDLVNSLSQVKEDSMARFITTGGILETEEAALVAANPFIRHITPHLQAMAASELIHLLKADVLQVTTDEQNEQQTDEKMADSQQSSCAGH